MNIEEMLGQAVHVHVDNIQDIIPPEPTYFGPATATEEREPEHADMRTFVLIPVGTANVSVGQGTGRNDIVQILSQDLTRKDAAISVLDTAVVLATSYGQVSDPANQVANVPFPVGILIPAGGTISLSTTDAVWVVNTTPATPCRVGVVITRRGSA
jgi:hypothetical protein